MDDVTFDHQRSLPPTAQARKDATWSALEATLAADARGRRMRRARITALVAIIAAIGVASMPRRTAKAPDLPPVRASAIEFVDGPRHRVALELVDDDELLEELHEMGLRRGIIRSPNAVIVVSR